ncbi:hypothetical protein HB82_05935 [Salmonella enterica subsp. enterica]|nr:hypothetical protein [Salmonella enterica subsp. enterica]
MRSLALFIFCGSPHTFTQRWINARRQKKEEEAVHGLISTRLSGKTAPDDGVNVSFGLRSSVGRYSPLRP